MRTRSFAVVAFLIGIAVIGASMFVTNDYFFFAAYSVLSFVVLATAWNILGGYAGYVNFGTGAFFALGAYTSVVLDKLIHPPLLVSVLCGSLVAGVVGIGMGYLTLRLRGVFFAIATLALSVMLFTLVVNWDFVGGSRGAYIIAPADAPLGFAKYVHFLYAVAVLMAAGSIVTARAIEKSMFGRGLAAIRDNEIAAECAGVPTQRLKLAATGISGAMMGMAGSIQPYFLSFVEPHSVFSLSYAVNAIAMPVVGGMANWIGPLVGAVLLGTVQQVATVTISSEVNLLIVGIVLIAFVTLAPRGILGLVSDWRARRKRVAEVEATANARVRLSDSPRPSTSARDTS